MLSSQPRGRNGDGCGPMVDSAVLDASGHRLPKPSSARGPVAVVVPTTRVPFAAVEFVG